MGLLESNKKKSIKGGSEDRGRDSISGGCNERTSLSIIHRTSSHHHVISTTHYERRPIVPTTPTCVSLCECEEGRTPSWQSGT